VAERGRTAAQWRQSSGDVDQGRLSAGPVFRRTYYTGEEGIATIAPHLSLLGHWDFVNEGSSTVGTGTVVQTPDVGATIGG